MDDYMRGRLDGLIEAGRVVQANQSDYQALSTALAELIKEARES